MSIFKQLKHRFRILRYRLRRFPPAQPTPLLTSRPFTVNQLYTCWHAYWADQLREPVHLHRKGWEYTYICQALYERGVLEPGKRGIGFGVGKEQLPALFASMGVQVVATDLSNEDRRRAGWHRDSRPPEVYLNEAYPPLCPPEQFAKLVECRVLDMREWNSFPSEEFDFCWSTGSLEHLGGIRHGEEFIRASLAALKPGGVAVHTTEFNLTSNDKTARTGMTVVYRRQDIELLFKELQEAGHEVALDWRGSEWPMTRYEQLKVADADGYLTVDIKDYAATSFGWIIVKGGVRESGE